MWSRSHALWWLLVLASAACSGEADAPPAPPTEPTLPAERPTDPPPSPVTEPSGEMPATPAAPGRVGDPETACARARPCCAAFVLAIGDDVEAERARVACEQMERLDELGQASGEACLAAIDGWRRALELREREIPGACL